MWLSGEYPRALDGLCKLLSLDMRVLDPAWIGMKLRKLLDFPEPLGDFMALVPGEEAANFPRHRRLRRALILHRYAMLGILDEDGRAIQQMGILALPEDDSPPAEQRDRADQRLGSARSCYAAAMIRRDGCEFCTACGADWQLQLTDSRTHTRQRHG